ncbi:MAG: hypothetical protein AAFZ38_00090 [Myxococcota bacterium]
MSLAALLTAVVIGATGASSGVTTTSPPTSRDIRPPLEATRVAGAQASGLDDVTVLKYATSFRVPIASDESGFVWLLGADYAFEDATFDTALGDIERLQGHRFALATRGNVPFSERWGLAFELQAIYASDLSAGASASLQPFARASVAYAYSSELSLQAAVVWLRTRLGLVPFGGFGAVYRPAGSRWRFNLVIPNPNVSFRLFDDARLFARAGLDTSTYAARLASGDDAFVHRLQIVSSAGIRWRLFGRFALSAEAGAVALQDYEVRNLDTDIASGRVSALGPYASLAIVRLLD